MSIGGDLGYEGQRGDRKQTPLSSTQNLSTFSAKPAPPPQNLKNSRERGGTPGPKRHSVTLNKHQPVTPPPSGEAIITQWFPRSASRPAALLRPRGPPVWDDVSETSHDAGCQARVRLLFKPPPHLRGGGELRGH